MAPTERQIPTGACDAHMHVFGPSLSYPAAPGALYAAPDASVARYRIQAGRVGTSRQVLVQPSYYRYDNAYLLHALQEIGDQARGVVMLEDGAIDEGRLRAMNESGVRGIRIDFFRAATEGQSLDMMVGLMKRLSAVAATVGWSIDLYAPGAVCLALSPHLAALPSACSVAHLGYLKVAEVSDSQCDRFLNAVVDSDNVWIKLTGRYRYDDPSRADELADSLLQRMPERLLWGSDWPHVMAPPQDEMAPIQWLKRIAGDTGLLDRILVDNPGRLYGFPAAG